MAALYTCTSVSTVIATQGNTVEQCTAVVMMLVGTSLWAQVNAASSAP